MESPVVIDLWTVAPERQDELTRLLEEILQETVVPRPGFVSAEIYDSADGRLVLVNITTASAEARRAITDGVEVHRAYREARKLASSHARFYRLVASFSGSSAESS